MTDSSIIRAPAVSAADPIRTAIVGTGYIAEFHARSIREAAGVSDLSWARRDPGDITMARLNDATATVIR